MNILIVGSGGREHALAWKINQSSRCEKLFIAPGNSGTAVVGTNVPILPDDFPALGSFCQKERIDLIVVGPEGPLVKGIRDFFESDNSLKEILMVGPGKAGAQLEGSKDFSKQFMVKYGVPTASARTFNATQLSEALTYLMDGKFPVVLKADGLAAGKGVIIATTYEEAQTSMREMLGGKFGDASAKVLVEEFLDGIEVSVFILTDGRDYIILPEAKDYKRIGEHDTGLNTGGMGAVSPVSFADEPFMQKVEERIIKPTIDGLKREGIAYRGFIFIGLIKVDNEPMVIEYNARMGDPETEAVMPRIKSDFVELLTAAAGGNLKGVKIEYHENCAVSVVMVAGGYPGDFKKGDIIAGLDGLADNALVFHAGAKRAAGGNVVTDGGRVIVVTGKGENIEMATENAYRAISGIHWNGVYFRKDIASDLKKLIVK